VEIGLRLFVNMGNSSSSSGRGHHDETVDHGHLTPQGVYTGPRDWNQAVVSQLICARRLAPFYRPLEEYDESWDDDQILAARKEPTVPESEGQEVTTRIEATVSSHSSVKSGHNKRPGALKEPSKPEAAVYRGAVECPICFLVRHLPIFMLSPPLSLTCAIVLPPKYQPL
jgi:hypothetical protein